MRLRNLFIFVFLIFIYKSLQGVSAWTLYHYPDQDNIPNALQAQNYIVGQLGQYKSLELCEEMGGALSHVYKHSTYECGFNCKYSEEYPPGLVICED